MAFAPSNPPATGNSDLERYLFSEFERLGNEVSLVSEAAIRALVAIGYGGIFGGGGAAGPALGLGFVVVDGFTDIQVAEPVSVIQDTAQNGLIVERAGVWLINVQVTFSHDEVNAGRQTTLRLWNATQSTVVADMVMGTGRNQDVTQYAAALLGDFSGAGVDDLLQLQMGGGDDYSLVSWETLLFSVNHVSELRGL